MTRKIIFRATIALVCGVSICFVACTKKETAAQASPKASGPTEKVRNEKVVVTEQALASDDVMLQEKERAVVAVFLDDGLVTTSMADGMSREFAVKRGQASFFPAGIVSLKNRGTAVLRVVRTEYLGKGGAEYWGKTGLAPHYTLLFENPYGRVYDIKIAAGMQEAMHTHHERVVVGLSGAELEHILPDGGKQSSSLKTGEIAWRPAATHIGQNIGKTDLWVIAIEPK